MISAPSVCVALLVALSGALVDAEVEYVHIKPIPRTYSETIKEFYDCVACSSDKLIQKEFTSCMSDLPRPIRKEWNACCRRHFNEQFCKNAYENQFEFGSICMNRKKTLEVERCMRKNVGKLHPDIVEFSSCKRRILHKHCFSHSED